MMPKDQHIYVIMHPDICKCGRDSYIPLCYETSEEAANLCAYELNHVGGKPADFPVIIKKVPLYNPPWDKVTGESLGDSQ